MSPSLKQYIKVAILFGLPYASLMALVKYKEDGTFSIYEFMFLFLFFGIAMSATFVTFQIKALKRAGISTLSDEDFQPKQTMEITSTKSEKEVLELLLKHDKYKKAQIDHEDNKIEIRVPIKWSTRGEIIKIQSEVIDKDKKKYHIETKPSYPLILMDDGKSRINLEVIKGIIS